jgi:hypothetical protein
VAKISLPSIVSALPQDLRNFLQRVREALNGGQIITADDLISSGIAELSPGGSLVPAPTTGVAVDYTPPPAPTNVTASGALQTIMLQWDDPGYANFAHAEIWRSAVDNIGTATLLGLTGTVLYPDAVPSSSTYYYWVRFVSQADVKGPYQGLSGILGQTSADPAEVIDILTANSLFQPGPYYYQATSTVINGVPVPAGTYIASAYIAHGSVGSLQIGTAVIDSGHVRELAVNKLTSGTITGQEITIGEGGNIKSGQTAFNTGSGWFLGHGVDGYSRFSIGDPTGPGLDYDESTGVVRFRGIMELRSGSTVGGISADNIGGWASGLDNTKIDGINIHADSSILTGDVSPQDGSKYSVLSGGEIEFFDYYSGSFKLYKSLKNIVTGTCQDGVQVNLGYFRTAPKVIISPKSLMAYRGAYSSQDQTFVLEANNIYRAGDDWYFTPTAQLQLSANYGTFGQQFDVSGNLAYTPLATYLDLYTGQVNFPANCRSVSISARIGRSYYQIVQGGYPNYQNTTYKATVVATVFIQYYSYGTWILGQSVTIGNDGSYPRYFTYDTVNLSVTSGADIQAVRVYVNFAKGGNVYDPWSYWNPIPSASINTETACIMSGSYSLTSAVISLNGQANYMAIG